MNRTDRRQQLVLILGCSLAGLLACGYAGEAAAQVPLRVDPALLGVPEPPPVAVQPKSRNEPAEVQPVEPDVVEVRPVAPMSPPEPTELSVKAEEAPEQAATPSAQPEVVDIAPRSAPSAAQSVPEHSSSEEDALAETRPTPMSMSPPEPAELPAEAEAAPEQAATPSAQPEAVDIAPQTASPAVQPTPEPSSGEEGALAETRRPAPMLPQSGETGAPDVQEPMRTDARPAVSSPSSSAPRATALESLRVDPALLGPPPSIPATRLAGSPESTVLPAPAPSEPVSSSSWVALPAGNEEDGHDDEQAPDRTAPLALRAAPKMAPLPEEDSSTPRPVFLSALQMAGEVNREFVAEGEAELRKIGSIVNSDSMTYWPLEDEVEAVGSARLQQKDDVVTGPKMRLRLEDQIGYFEQPFYQLKHLSAANGKRASEREESDRRIERLANASALDSGFVTPQAMKFVSAQFGDKVEKPTTTEARGEAERIHFEGEDKYRL
ncbi:MAG: hypothetical protein LBU46_00545, partial [Candidatus Accumulibacter sp.]|nr:hypothetical protein [Accumulibacter sp.]